MARLEGQLQQLQEDKVENIKCMQNLEEKNQVLEEKLQLSIKNEDVQLKNLAEDNLKGSELELKISSDQSEQIRQMEVQIQDLQKQLQVSNDARAASKEKRGECEEVYEEAYGGEHDERIQMQTDDLQNDQQQNRCKICCLIS